VRDVFGRAPGSSPRCAAARRARFPRRDTPVLQEVPGGGHAAVFTHHNSLDRDLFLRSRWRLHLKHCSLVARTRLRDRAGVFARGSSPGTTRSSSCSSATGATRTIRWMRLVEELCGAAMAGGPAARDQLRRESRDLTRRFGASGCASSRHTGKRHAVGERLNSCSRSTSTATPPAHICH